MSLKTANDLTGLECQLLENAVLGVPTDCRTGDPAYDDPINGSDWGAERTVRGEAVRAIVLNLLDDGRSFDAKGIALCGIRITGELDFLGADLSVRLIFRGCSFEEAPLLVEANTRALNFDGSCLPGLDADRLVAHGNVTLDDGFHATGEVRLVSAEIAGQLSFRGARLVPIQGDALCADHARVGGNVYLDSGLRCSGEVRLLGTQIRGQLICSGSRFEAPNGDALRADGARISDTVFLDDGFHASGNVSIALADLNGNLICSGGRFEASEGNALDLNSLKTRQSIHLNDGFYATGEVNLNGAEIGGQLSCRSGHFRPTKGSALNADRAKIARGVALTDGFHATAEVRLMGTEIIGQLACSGARFEPEAGDALSLDGAKITGGVYFDKAFCSGQVRLLGSDIHGQLVFSGTHLKSISGGALVAAGAKITDSVFLDEGFFVEGEVALQGVCIGHCLFLEFDTRSKFELDLSHAKVDTLSDSESSWPKRGRLHIDGFRYTRLHRNAPLGPVARLRWLRLQAHGDGDFYPQPYEHRELSG